MNCLKNKPKSIIIDVSRDCNQRCYFCWRDNCRDHLKQINKIVKDKAMPFEIFKKIVDDASQYDHITWLSLSGPIGEPLLVADIVDYLEYVDSKKHFKHVVVNTNGQNLREHDFSRLLNSLTEICFSVDTIDSNTFFSIHNSIFMDNVIGGIVALCDHKKKYGGKGLIKVRFTEGEYNRGQFEEFNDFFKPIVDDVKYVKVHSFMGVMKEENSRLGAYFCNQIYNVVNFNLKGELTTCCLNWRLEPVFGSIEVSSIADLWNSNKYREWVFSRLLYDGICSKCSGLGTVFSQSCNVENSELLRNKASKVMHGLIVDCCENPHNYMYRFVVNNWRDLYKKLLRTCGKSC